ncbi:MAG: OB-fold domain-containing protein [Alphaproteobacteria bacterium]|nr:OB-fold domain-containing protein [Alphaproteobacteria bacterium]
MRTEQADLREGGGVVSVSLKGPGPVAQYLKYLSEGRFMLQRSSETGELLYYPRSFARGAPSAGLEWVEMSGLGTVYSFTTVRRKPEHGGDYNISLVELVEGPRMLTRVLGMDPNAVSIGLKVRARIEKPAWDPKAEQPLVVFYPA